MPTNTYQQFMDNQLLNREIIEENFYKYAQSGLFEFTPKSIVKEIYHVRSTNTVEVIWYETWNYGGYDEGCFEKEFDIINNKEKSLIDIKLLLNQEKIDKYNKIENDITRMEELLKEKKQQLKLLMEELQKDETFRGDYVFKKEKD